MQFSEGALRHGPITFQADYIEVIEIVVRGYSSLSMKGVMPKKMRGHAVILAQ